MDETDRRIALQRGFIAALALALTVIFVWMIRHYLAALFLAAVLAIFLAPMQDALARALRGRVHLAGALMLVFAVIAIVTPLTGLLVLVARQAVEVAQTVIPWAQEQIRAFRAEGLDGLPAQWQGLRETLAPYQDEIARRLSQLAASLGGALMGGLFRAPAGALIAMMNTIVFLFALFYMLTGGRKNLQAALDLLPMAPDGRRLLAERALSTIRATVKGTFVIALVQGGLTGVALAVAGVPGAAFWGAVAGVLSIVPVVGPPLVWAPAGIWLLVSGETFAGIGVLVFGGVVIGHIDNILRPRLVGHDAKMSDLMVLLSTLGGLSLFGAVGIVIGPVIAALFASAWFIYAESFRPLLADAPPGPDGEAETPA